MQRSKLDPLNLRDLSSLPSSKVSDSLLKVILILSIIIHTNVSMKRIEAFVNTGKLMKYHIIADSQLSVPITIPKLQIDYYA